MKPTITLKRAPEAPPAPVFDPTANTGEVGGIEGVRYVQGAGHLFNARKEYVRTDKSFAMEPLTEEQEANRRKQALSNKKFFISANPKIREAGLPQQVIEAERENARARAAEAFAS